MNNKKSKKIKKIVSNYLKENQISYSVGEAKKNDLDTKLEPVFMKDLPDTAFNGDKKVAMSFRRKLTGYFMNIIKFKNATVQLGDKVMTGKEFLQLVYKNHEEYEEYISNKDNQVLIKLSNVMETLGKRYLHVSYRLYLFFARFGTTCETVKYKDVSEFDLKKINDINDKLQNIINLYTTSKKDITNQITDLQAEVQRHIGVDRPNFVKDKTSTSTRNPSMDLKRFIGGKYVDYNSLDDNNPLTEDTNESNEQFIYNISAIVKRILTILDNVNSECNSILNSELSQTDMSMVAESKQEVEIVSQNDKYNFRKSDGSYISKVWFDFVWSFKNGYARVEINDKMNFINERGKLLSDVWFDLVYSFYDGFARVILNDKWNYIKEDGKLLSDIWFDYAHTFYRGIARVKIKNTTYELDKYGNLKELK